MQVSHWLDDYFYFASWGFWRWVSESGIGFDLRADSHAFARWFEHLDPDPPEEVTAEVADSLKRLDALLDLKRKFSEWNLEEDETFDYLLFVLEMAYYQVDPDLSQWGGLPEEVLVWAEKEVPDFGQPEVTLEFMQAYVDEYRESVD
jgi:hypothetical protein